MPSFLPLAKGIEPWPAGSPGILEKARLESLLDNVYFAETSPMAEKTPPVLVEGESLRKGSRELRARLTNLYFGVLEKGRVVAPPVAVINRHADILGDISIDWRHPRRNHKYRGWKWVRDPLFLPGKSLCLAATGAETFFHLVFDSLSRIWLAERAGFSLRDFDQLIVQQDTPLLRRFLEILGGSGPKLVDLSKIRHVVGEHLFVGSYQSAPGHYHPEYLQWLRVRVRKFLSSQENCADQRVLLLSRSLAGSRRLLNEGEVIRAFPPGSVLSVALEKLSLDQQLGLFTRARAVVAPHGGGLTHLAWVVAGTPVLELFPQNFFNSCYWELASSVGARYGCLEGRSEGSARGANRNFTISPDLVRSSFFRLAENILSDPPSFTGGAG
jgi:capsular polysaccharide biosynthesis protein